MSFRLGNDQIDFEGFQQIVKVLSETKMDDVIIEDRVSVKLNAFSTGQ